MQEALKIYQVLTTGLVVYLRSAFPEQAARIRAGSDIWATVGFSRLGLALLAQPVRRNKVTNSHKDIFLFSYRSQYDTPHNLTCSYVIFNLTFVQMGKEEL